MVESDSDDKDGDVESDGARLQQINCEVKDVVVLALVQLFSEDELVYLPHFWVDHGAILVFHLGLVLAEVQQDLPDQ